MRGSHTLFRLKRGSVQGEAWGVHSTHPTITSKVDIQGRRCPNIFPLTFTILELQKLSPEVTCPVSRANSSGFLTVTVNASGFSLGQSPAG